MPIALEIRLVVPRSAGVPVGGGDERGVVVAYGSVDAAFEDAMHELLTSHELLTGRISGSAAAVAGSDSCVGDAEAAADAEITGKGNGKEAGGRPRVDSGMARDMLTHARLMRLATETSEVMVAAMSDVLDQQAATKLQSVGRAKLARANTKERRQFVEAAQAATDAVIADIDRAAAAAEVIAKAGEMVAALPPRKPSSGALLGPPTALPSDANFARIGTIAQRLARLAGGSPCLPVATGAADQLDRLSSLVSSIEASASALEMTAHVLSLEAVAARLTAAISGGGACVRRSAAQALPEAERLARMERAVCAIEAIVQPAS